MEMPWNQNAVSAREVLLRIPDTLAYQLVFRQQVQTAFELSAANASSFFFFSSPWDALPHARALCNQFGKLGFAKLLAKLVSTKRYLYCVLENGYILHFAWMTVSWCRHYKLRAGDVVIGPIWTSERARGRGVATYATKAGINSLFRLGYRFFFIDTSYDNTACLCVIKKCGFGPPVASFLL